MRRIPSRRAAVVGLLVALALVPSLGPAAAQVVTRPIVGEFEDLYLVVGRIVDKDGLPVNQAFLDISVEGLRGIAVKPFRVGTSCFGDFSGVINLKELPPGKAKVTATLIDPEDVDGFKPTAVTGAIDRTFRRTDLTMKLPFAWPSECMEGREFWAGRISVSGRVVNYVGEHDRNGTTVLADPIKEWPVWMNLTLKDEPQPFRAPTNLATDVRGDFKYSWTFENPATPTDITVAIERSLAGHDLGIDGRTVKATFDPVARIAFVKLNLGPDPPNETPFPAGLLALAAIVATAAALSTRVRGRDR